MNVNKTKTLGWMLLVALAGCQDGTSSAPADDPSPTPVPLVVGPLHAMEVVKHAALAFQADGDAFVGGYRAHDATIRNGVVMMTPYSFDAGERTSHADVTIQTASITMEGTAVEPLSQTRIDDGEVVLSRGVVEERFRNDIDGLHQSWQFAEGPSLDGDLVVEVSLTGYHYVTSTDQGLHFAGADGMGVRYSHAVWSDASGKEWPIAAVYDNGLIRMSIPADVINDSAFPAMLDPTIGAETAVDAVVVGNVGTNTQQPAIAFNGTNYLVVWSDNRDSVDADIWGTRVTAAGAVLDPLGLKISTTAGTQSNPTVAFNGSVFMVGWEDFKVHGGTDSDISTAKVTNNGVVTALAKAASTATSETRPIAVQRGTSVLLVWNANGTTMGAISAAAAAFGAPFTIAASTVVERAGAAASPAGNFLVTYSTATDLKGQFITSAGALSGAAITISAGAGSQQESSASFDGTNFDVVYVNNTADLYGTRVSSAGAVLDTHMEGAATVGGKVISAAAGSQRVPVISCAAALGCLVLWEDNRNLATTNFDLFAQRLNTNFTLNGAEITLSNANLAQHSPAIAATATGWLAAWNDDRDANGNTVFGATISTAGALGTAIPLATGNARESAPHVGVSGGIFGVFWSDSRTYGNDIRFTRFSVAGTKLDATSRVASSAANAQLSPAASTDLGANSFLVWSDARNGQNKDIFGARVAMATGAVLDANGIQIAVAAGDQLLPDIASNGSVALAVWQDRRNGTFDIFGALISSAGTVMVPNIVICNAASDQGHPSVVWDASVSQFLVVWSDSRSGTSNIFGARVSAAGAVLDANGVKISNGAIGQFGPAIATSGSGSFAVWEDRRNAPAGGYNIYGSRITGGSTFNVLDAAGLKLTTAAAAQRQDSPSIAFIGSSYAIAWDDDRNVQGDIFGQQVTTAGALSGTEFTIAASANNEVNVQLRGYSTNVGLITYESNVSDTSRTEVRLLTAQSPTGSVCSAASQCQTGFCVDGRCCNTACGGGDTTDCQACRGSITNGVDGTCLPMPSTTVCRNYESTFCDLREYCDGTHTACPVDTGRNQGLVCNKNTNVPPGTGNGLCPTNAAPGPHFCQ